MHRYFDLILLSCLLACVCVCGSNAESLHLACVYSSPFQAKYGVVDMSHITNYYIIMTPCIQNLVP
jgi:hypothetical protein